MFIRWVKRGHKNSNAANLTFHDAYLVKSYRNDEGKPRQQNIAYLGNVRQIGSSFPAIEREIFLLRAKDVLDTISSLSAFDRNDIMQQLHRRIPPLSTDEMLTGFENTLIWYLESWQTREDAPPKEEIRALVDAVMRKS